MHTNALASTTALPRGLEVVTVSLLQLRVLVACLRKFDLHLAQISCEAVFVLVQLH